MIHVEQWRSMGEVRRLLDHELFIVDSGPPPGSPGEGKGDGAVLLLLHGFPTSSWDWAPIWPELSRRYRVVAPDLLGFGFSAKPKRHRYSILEQADLVEAAIAALGLGEVEIHVLAHDYGDTVAQELLARQDEGRGIGRWRSLCLLNGGLFPETHRPRTIQKLLTSPLGPLVSRLNHRGTFARSFSAVFGPKTKPTPAELDAFWAIIRHDDGALITHLLMRYMPERVEHRARWVGALGDTALPLALINGSLDPVSGAHMVRRYRELFGDDDTIVELADIGHYPQVEAPTEVLAAYLAFLDPLGG